MWPEQQSRLERLHAAIDVAKNDPSHLVAGDLNGSISDLVRAAPSTATVVVFHSAVLNYLSPGARQEFIATIGTLRCHWIANEGPGVLPLGSETLPPWPDPTRSMFTLAVDGTAVAYTDPHGASLHWFESCST